LVGTGKWGQHAGVSREFDQECLEMEGSGIAAVAIYIDFGEFRDTSTFLHAHPFLDAHQWGSGWFGIIFNRRRRVGGSGWEDSIFDAVLGVHWQQRLRRNWYRFTVGYPGNVRYSDVIL
jgi:hypothetical protein